jgi:hypothetical protein
MTSSRGPANVTSKPGHGFRAVPGSAEGVRLSQSLNADARLKQASVLLGLTDPLLASPVKVSNTVAGLGQRVLPW